MNLSPGGIGFASDMCLPLTKIRTACTRPSGCKSVAGHGQVVVSLWEWCWHCIASGYGRQSKQQPVRPCAATHCPACSLHAVCCWLWTMYNVQSFSMLGLCRLNTGASRLNTEIARLNTGGAGVRAREGEDMRDARHTPSKQVSPFDSSLLASYHGSKSLLQRKWRNE